MKILNLEQGSQEWLKARLGLATASNFDKIITSTGKESATLPKYALELATEKLLLEPEPTYKNPAMERGNELEPLAREFYQEATLEEVKQIGMMISDCGDFGYSPDGLIGEEGLIEIKCPQATTHAKYLLDDKLPTDYVQQIQGGLFVSGRKWIDFVSFHPNFTEGKRLFVKRVFRDEGVISALKDGINKVIYQRNEILKQILGE